MTTANPEHNPNELTANQAEVLQGFVGHFTHESNTDPRRTGYYDQVQAFMRERFDVFGLPMDTPESYFPVMAGISIASLWVERLIAEGLSPHEAAEVVQDGFARLAPPGCIPLGD